MTPPPFYARAPIGSIFAINSPVVAQGCRNREGPGDRGAIALSDFGRSVNRIPIRGADYVHHITTYSLLGIFRPSYGPVPATVATFNEGEDLWAQTQPHCQMEIYGLLDDTSGHNKAKIPNMNCW